MVKLLTVKDVAGLTSVSVRSIWKLTAAGQFPKPMRIGRSVRWRAIDVQNWIRNGCKMAEAVAAR